MKIGILFERAARILFYSALLFGVYKIISFEVMIMFGFAMIIISIEEFKEN